MSILALENIGIEDSGAIVHDAAPGLLELPLLQGVALTDPSEQLWSGGHTSAQLLVLAALGHTQPASQSRHGVPEHAQKQGQ
jgi:hypothetical protein